VAQHQQRRLTLLEVDNPHLDIVQKETFGPVLTMQVFDTEAEAISLANDANTVSLLVYGRATYNAHSG
jgi:acyl-CoA reductase-like NAD-dependent aldehyde dehydrogenase